MAVLVSTDCRWWRDREIARPIATDDDGERLNLEQERAWLARAQRHRVELELSKAGGMWPAFRKSAACC